MHNTAEQVDLVGLLGLDENFFGLVTLLRGEDGVCFRGGDGEGACDCGELSLLDEPFLLVRFLLCSNFVDWGKENGWGRTMDVHNNRH